VKAKVIEVDVAPARASVIDDANENLFAFELPQIGHRGSHFFYTLAAGLKDYFIGIGTNDLDAFGATSSATDEEARVGVRYGEWN
jgi:hypothetical protein